MNFADIAKMGTKEQDTVIDGMDEKEISRFEQYIRESKLKVANQVEKKIDEKIEAANQETIQLRIANVAKLKLLAEKN